SASSAKTASTSRVARPSAGRGWHRRRALPAGSPRARAQGAGHWRSATPGGPNSPARAAAAPGGSPARFGQRGRPHPRAGPLFATGALSPWRPAPGGLSRANDVRILGPRDELGSDLGVPLLPAPHGALSSRAAQLVAGGSGAARTALSGHPGS